MESFKPTVTRLEERITPSPLWNIWCSPPCCAVVIALPTGYALGPALPPEGEVEPGEETMRLLRKPAAMADDDEAGAWFDRLMALNGELFAAGHYEAAYHALMAALHLVKGLADETRLLEVARVAGEQGSHIDALKAAHRL